MRMQLHKVSSVVLITFYLYLSLWITLHLYTERQRDVQFTNARPEDCGGPSEYVPATDYVRCRWPPDSISELLNPETDLYDLAIQPCVHSSKRKGHKDPWVHRYYHLLKSLYSGVINNGSWTYKAYLMEQQLRIEPREYNYRLYPQLIDLEDVVSSVEQGRPVNQAPMNNPSMLILQAPDSFCQPITQPKASSDLVVIIKSCVRCRKERDNARATFMQPHLWGSFSIHFVFVTGLPAKDHTGLFHFDGLLIEHRSHGNAEHDDVQRRRDLFAEAQQHGDMLIGNFTDHYFSLTDKQSFAFRWAAAFCSQESALFLFLDHDFSVIPKNLIRFIKGLPILIRPDVSAGIYGQNQYVGRPSLDRKRNRWSLSTNEVPWPMYPPYFGGHAYIKGIRVVRKMALASAFLPSMRIEDAHMGFTRYKLHIPTYGLRHFVHGVRSSKDLEKVTCVNSRFTRKYFNWETGEIKM